MLSGHLCRCTGYEPIVDAIARGRRSVNLAPQPPLRRRATPRREALVAGEQRLTYAELRERAARIAGGLAALGVESRRPPRGACSTNRLETVAALLGLPVARRGLRPALLAPRPTTTSTTASTDCGAAVVIRDRRRGHERARRLAGRAPGRARPRRARAVAPCSTRPARPGGRRASRARTAPSARRALAGRPARPPPRRPHARRDAAVPHDGHPLAARDAARRRLLRRAAVAGIRSRRCELIERERIDIALPRPDALPRPRPPPATRSTSTSPACARSPMRARR